MIPKYKKNIFNLVLTFWSCIIHHLFTLFEFNLTVFLCRDVQYISDEEQANDPHWWVMWLYITQPSLYHQLGCAIVLNNSLFSGILSKDNLTIFCSFFVLVP